MPQSSSRRGMARARAPLERTIDVMLTRYTMHDVLHAMVEACYVRAGADEAHRHQETYYSSQWREIARYLTGVEAATAMLEL